MTDQDAALVARLREMANEGRQWKLPRVEVEQELVEEAVARIEALTAERDELRGWHRAALIASAPYVTEHNNPDEWQTQQTEALVRIFDRATAAEAALAERDKDAERYRFMRGEGPEVMALWKQATLDMSMTLTVLDAAIDAALRASAKD